MLPHKDDPAISLPMCIIADMEMSIVHERQEETPEAKAKWFQSLSLAERMELFCAFTDMILDANPQIVERKDAQPIEGRVLVLPRT
jgi:uncharacterized protein (DUF1919 family)